MPRGSPLRPHHAQVFACDDDDDDDVVGAPLSEARGKLFLLFFFLSFRGTLFHGVWGMPREILLPTKHNLPPDALMMRKQCDVYACTYGM